MTAGEMFKFWMMYKLGVPVAIFLAIIICGLVYVYGSVYIIDPIKSWRRKRRKKARDSKVQVREPVPDVPDGTSERVYGRQGNT